MTKKAKKGNKNNNFHNTGIDKVNSKSKEKPEYTLCKNEISGMTYGGSTTRDENGRTPSGKNADFIDMLVQIRRGDRISKKIKNDREKNKKDSGRE